MTRTYGNFTDFIDFSRASSGTALRKVSYGAELVTNGDFSSALSGTWTTDLGSSSGGTVGIVNGELVITQGTNSVWMGVWQELDVTGIDTVTISAQRTATSGGGGGMRVGLSIGSGASSSTPDLGYLEFATTTTGDKAVTIDVSAYTTVYLSIREGSDVGRSSTADNISVKEVTFDQADGTLELFNHPAGIPRVEYDVNGNEIGLLIEEQRTNLVTYSEPSASGFGVFRSSLSTSTVASPDGGFAQKLAEDSSAGLSHYLGTGSLGMSLNTTYTMSWFAKAAERNFIAMNIYSGTTSYWTWFDLSNGTVGTATNSPATFIEDYGNGWYRCGITVTTAASGTPNTATYIAPSNGVLNYDGDGTSGVYLYGAQLEAGSFLTSYIPTSGATATRSADIADIATANFGYNPKAGTIVVEYQVSTQQSAFVAGYGKDSTNYVGLGYANYQSYVQPLVGGIGTSSTFDGQRHKQAVSFNSTGAWGTKVSDNSVVFKAATGGVPALSSSDTLYFGTSPFDTSVRACCYIRSIKYIPRRNTNTQLQEFTS